jgi:thiamine biosynthesis lipoprotein
MTDDSRFAGTSWTDWSCTVRVTVDEPSSLPQAVALTASLMFDVAAAIDRFDPESDVSRANLRAGRLTPVSRLCRQIVYRALQLADETDGACDPTVGAHVLAAGYDRDIAEVHHRPGVSIDPAALRRPSWRAVSLDSRFDLLTVPVGITLDLGAVGKAWTADEAARRIALVLGCSALVEIGGDLAVAGAHKSWQVTVSERADAAGQRMTLDSGGVATSSTVVRCWDTTGEPAHHIVDPRTGAPSDSRWRSASVWAPTAAEANAWSTASIVLGTDVVALLDERGLPARLVDREGRISFAGGWPLPDCHPSEGEAAS